ncbi:hypothetical protein DAPPUDRAFT_220200 [Daphnia pulex]|uniref:Cystatin domain-containing protein n=1 Tax=Daphnia pulex TaxID=6669 RepID=E9FR54_DAPPU|nr:hypothetical protein DAPPUDRAFT_220200 [Daphnia pulex]|eukprot:EFX90104.1 hypothetical protein DAPPUDRAFT_220200 [Daphnia pulex]
MAAHLHLSTRTLFLLVVVALTFDSTTSASLNKPNATESVQSSNRDNSSSISASEAQHFANFAAHQISSSNNSTLPMKPGENGTLIKIVQAESKVNGENGTAMNFKMTLKLDGGDEEDDLLCEVIVMSRSDLVTEDELTLTDYTCLPINNGSAEAMPEVAPLPLFIPFFPISVNDTKIQEIADFASKAVAYTRNSFNNLTRIENAETQVYATGINYKLKLKLKGADGEEMLCEVTVSDPTKKDAVVTRELSQYNCLLNSTSSAEFEEDIPDESVLSTWFFE